MPGEWRVAKAIAVPTPLRDALGGHPLVARLLAQRGITDPDAALAYLDPAQYRPAAPQELPGMTEAVAVIRGAIERGERVRVWGDFDADGQTSTVVLQEALQAAGARVDYQVPRRREGHGFHARAVRDALADDVSLLITCDTGIGARDVVQEAIEAGLRVVITDHHDLPEILPAAQAVVDPKMLAPDHPLRELAGVGVAYMVACALLGDGAEGGPLEQMLDIVALGLVADVARQVADVRYLIQRGLVVLRRSARPGLRALARVAELRLGDVDEDGIGFQLAPRLNAAGRLADAEMAIRLLLTKDEAEAQALADELEALNRDRQAMSDALLAEARARLQRAPEALRQPAIVLDGEGWEPGVLGLVAGHLAREYGRPAILIGHRPGRASMASARSVEWVDIHAAIASQRAHLLSEGGHPMAAGCSIERAKVDLFRQGLWAWMRERAVAPPKPILEIDAEVPWSEVDLDLAREIGRLAPFGEGNPTPVLLTGGGTLTRVEDISRRAETPHRRLFVDSDEGRALRFTWFNAQELPQVGERLEIAFTARVNRWRGRERLDLQFVDWRPAFERIAPEISRLVAGREVIDWRGEPNLAGAVRRLAATGGGALLLWAEGVLSEDAVRRAVAQEIHSRHDLRGRKSSVLGILAPPPGPEALQWLLEQVQPQQIYVLPLQAVREPSASAFLRQVGGMLRVALRDHEGWIDSLRMASRVGARQAAIVAALRGFEAQGKIALVVEDGRLRAYGNERGPGEHMEDTEEPGPGADTGARRKQAAAALAHLLGETSAYHLAFSTMPLASLFHSKDKQGSGGR